MGETQVETIPYQRYWTEYETVEKKEYIPKQITEYE